MAQYTVYTCCEDVDPVRPTVTPPPDPKPSGGLPDGGKPGQVLSVDDDGNQVWVTGGGGGGSVTLYNTTGQSTTGGMTQKAITDELDGKVAKVTGKGLSTNDYTTAEKQKLASLENYDDTALAARVAALEALLAQYSNVQLEMSDGTNTESLVVLGKEA